MGLTPTLLGYYFKEGLPQALHFLNLQKMTQLTFHSGKYHVPTEWRNPEWVSDFRNFPDPLFRHLHKEYDWVDKDSKGLLYGYIKQLAGKEHADGVYSDVSVRQNLKSRNTTAQPFYYFLFAVGAAKIINNPGLLRLPYYKSLTGGHIVNYVNTVPIKDLFPENYEDHEVFSKMQDRKTLIPIKYSALYARTFNTFSGVLNGDEIKVVRREENLVKCPVCSTIFDRTGTKTYKVEDTLNYTIAQNRLTRQEIQRANRENE